MKYIVGSIVLIALIVVAGWIASYMELLPSIPGLPGDGSGASQTEDQPDGEPSSYAGAVALGRLEPAGGVIEISGTPGEILQRLPISESGLVKKGADLAYMQSHEVRLAERNLIKSQIEEAKVLLAAKEKLAQTRIVSAELGVEKAKMQDLDIKCLEKKIQAVKRNLEQAEKDYARLQRLHGQPDDPVSDQELERQELLVRQAEAELAAAEADLEKLDRTRELNTKVAEADLEAAQAALEQIKASSQLKSLETQLALANAKLALAKIEAPTGGTVLKVFMEPGESIGAKPILQLADLTQMVAIAEVHENEVRRIREGQKAIIMSSAFPPPYDPDTGGSGDKIKGLTGVVDRISKVVTTPGLKSLDPFARADRHVVEVRLRIDDKKQSEVAARFTNLQVDIRFLNTEAASRSDARPSRPASR